MLNKNTKILDHAKPPALKAKGHRKPGQMEMVTSSLLPIPYPPTKQN